ncbi:MAG: YihY/virulence factor BrkB family protein [Planctomycetota bacterium]|nr:YihY/virulence factor BrkB family protein [Planctomycetota bacterium]
MGFEPPRNKPVDDALDNNRKLLPQVPNAPAPKLKGWLWSLFPNLRDAAMRWSEDDASSLAAAVAYYLALSLFPMLLLLTSAFGLLLEFTEIGQGAQEQLLETVAKHGSPVIEEQVAQVLNQLKSQSLVGGPFGILAAILAAIAVFAQLDRGFDRIWRIQSIRGQTLKTTVLGVLRHRLLAFSMLVGLGGMLVALFVAGMVFAQIRTFAGSTIPSLSIVFNWMQLAFVVLANAALFAMVYKWLPKKHVEWNEAIRGGILVAIIWELGRVILGFFLIGMKYTSAYGVIGSFIAILLWCYYGMSIFFFGAEYVQVLQRKRDIASELPKASNAVTSTATQEKSTQDKSIAADSTAESIVEESNEDDSDEAQSEYLRKVEAPKPTLPKIIPYRV